MRRVLDAWRLRHRSAVHRDRHGARYPRRVLRAPDELADGVRGRARLAGRCRVVRPGARDPGVHLGPVAAEAPRLGGGVHLRHGDGHAPGEIQHPVDRGYRQALLRRHAEPRCRLSHRVDGLPVSDGHPRAADRSPGARDGADSCVPDGEHLQVPQRQGHRHGVAPIVPGPLPRRGGARADRHASAHRAGAAVVHLPGVRAHRPRVFEAAAPPSRSGAAGSEAGSPTNL